MDHNAHLSRLRGKIANYVFWTNGIYQKWQKKHRVGSTEPPWNGIPARDQNGECSEVLQIVVCDMAAVIKYNDVRAETDKDQLMRALRKLKATDFWPTNDELAEQRLTGFGRQ